MGTSGRQQRVIAHSSPSLGRDGERAVLRAIRGGHLSDGPDIEALAQDMCKSLRVPAGIATSSGTAALHLALLALKVREGDEVILPSYVCAALLYAVRYCGGIPVLVDSAEAGYNITADTVRPALTRRTKAILVPHMFGLTADLDALSEFGIPIIEDCAHALGAVYKGRPVGGIGKLSVFSFYATKMIAAAGGGFLASPDANLIEAARDLSSYNGKKGAGLRFNYSLSNIQAAIACCQLKHLDSFVLQRKKIAAQYNAAFRDLPLGLPDPHPECMDHVYYRYMLQVPTSAEEFRRAMLQLGVRCGCGVLEPLHRSLGLPAQCFPNADRAADHAVSIPIYPALRERDIQNVAAAVRQVVTKEQRHQSRPVGVI